MKLEHTVNQQIISYPDLYWDIDRPYARLRVLDELFLNPFSDFEWTRDGYLFNVGIRDTPIESAPPYKRQTCDEFINIEWLEDNKGRQRRGGWRPSLFNENSNLFKIPDNVQADYLEAAYEVAKKTYQVLKNLEPERYYLMPSFEQISRDVNGILDAKEDASNFPYLYRKAHEEGILTLEWAINYHKNLCRSKMNLMLDELDDKFFSRYKNLKETQGPITAYLDDNRPTPDNFDVHVYDSEHLMEMLSYKNITHISLDNDLGPYCHVEGYQVARFLEEQAFENKIPKLQIQIHSANTVASKEMQQAIAKCNEFWEQHETKTTNG